MAGKKSSKSSANVGAAQLVEAFIEGRKSLRRYTTTESAVEAFRLGAMLDILTGISAVNVTAKEETGGELREEEQ